jgi:adenylate cyclase
MRAARRIVLEEALLGAGFLTAAWYLYCLVGIWALLDYLEEGLLKAYITGPGIHLEILVSGLGFGAVLALVNRFSDSPWLRRRPFGQIILLKSVFYLAALLVLAVLVNLLFLAFVFSWAELRELQEAMTPRLMMGLALFQTASILAANFLLEVRRKVGPGNLWALMSGRYHKPRDEERIFLFLDLKGSTSITEELGHARYSQFIRSCFHDLTEFVLLFGGQIYQYVGDEVVLSWPSRSPSAERFSLETFFAFQHRLSERRSWYVDQFGVHPEFRAGIADGKVTVTEVGDIKREIAFHGDALNTAARLLELCREMERPVLVSGPIQKAIAAEPDLTTHPQGEFTLRGKAEPVPVFGVEWSVA